VRGGSAAGLTDGGAAPQRSPTEAARSMRGGRRGTMTKATTRLYEDGLAGASGAGAERPGYIPAW